MSKVCIKNLKYKYKEDAADVLKGVSFEVPKGKVSALLGPNGSGKSTLFKILLKILIPYEGKIYIDGKDVDSIDASYLSKIMAWIPQEEDSFFPYTVYEYVLMGRAPHLGFFDVPNEEDEEVVYNVLHRLGLLKIAHRKVPSLSGGEKRLVSIARALAQESDILIMDEPTAHLDLGNKATVLSIVKKMADSGKTIFFSTHDPNEASFVA
ncbi:MAG: ABC transporter ATP-binding protein, partial [Thermoproteota archaeon]